MKHIVILKNLKLKDNMRKIFSLFIVFTLFHSLACMDTIEEETPENSLSLLIEREEKSEKKTKDALFEYAIKELMERFHEEKTSRKRQQCQKYFSMGVLLRQNPSPVISTPAGIPGE